MRNQQKIIWIFGGIASSKERFIRYILKNNPKRLLPLADHSIIFLYVPAEITYKRWQNKPWKKFWYVKKPQKVDTERTF